MTKTQAIKEHLLERGSITSWEAIHQYHATRLSAIIFNLRKRGYDIESVRVDGIDIYGNDSHWTRYVLKGEDK